MTRARRSAVASALPPRSEVLQTENILCTRVHAQYIFFADTSVTSGEISNPKNDASSERHRRGSRC